MSPRQVTTKGPLRRGQLVAPFGVGAMVIVRDGSSLIGAGLDHWFDTPEGYSENMVDVDEFKIEEWRLEKELKVDHFRLPPDYRERRPYSPARPNEKLTVPYLRFPTWHYCTSCHYMYQLKLTIQGPEYCPHCLETKNRRRRLIQVPIIALRAHGHIQDFPWREWVHSDSNPSCTGRLKLRSTGGATLSAQRVECTGCGESRSLGQVMGQELILNPKESKEPLHCLSHHPWLGETDGTGDCGAYLRGSLRTASNVYFAQVRSAIYLPRSIAQVPQSLLEIMTSPQASAILAVLGDKTTPGFLRSQLKVQLMPYDDAALEQAIRIVLSGRPQDAEVDDEAVDGGETAFRRAEYEVLIADHDEDLLKVKGQSRSLYHGLAAEHFERIMLVDKLRETRALVGFTRVHADAQPLDQMKSLLRRHPVQSGTDWLPAYKVFGEGIFLRVDENRLVDWEQQPSVRKRAQRLQDRYDSLNRNRQRTITPRFVMLHTLAHLLMNRLTYECGYSSASLRERLYASVNQETPGKSMAGILIYTAAGDSEGTMGGLVRMGKPGVFEDVLLRALQGAQWCSADPVCMEMGGSSGQGPNSLNLAACHSCGLVPETACEEFNTFLDRALVVGDLSDPTLGFFRVDGQYLPWG